MFSKKIFIPEGVNVTIERGRVTVKGKAGEVIKQIGSHGVKVTIEDKQVQISTTGDLRKVKRLFGTAVSHVKNMLKGASEGYTYKMKVCYVHFPCTVKTEGNKIIVDNFLGERTPRTATKLPNVDIKIAKQDITLTGADLEAVSQTAANIEQATRITKRDRRVFQDGVFITQKAE